MTGFASFIRRFLYGIPSRNDSALSRMLIAFAFLIALPSYGRNTDDPEELFAPFIAKYDSEEALEDMRAKGANILRHRGGLALVIVPQDSLPLFTTASSTRNGGHFRLERGRKMTPAMDVARTHFGADRIAAGTGLPLPYSGKGVVTGFCDIFFDPSHVNFYDNDGKSRIKKLICYDELHNRRTVMDSEEQYLAWGTDNNTGSHATHVAGIMAGSCMNGFQGAALESEIVATVSMLSDVGILAGAEDIIEYAKSQGKPAVINMSLSNYTGPHDGSSLFSQYLAMLGEEAIICMAAGNEGSSPVHAPANFSDSLKSVKLLLADTQWDYFTMEGYVDIWSRDSRPFAVRIHVFDSDEGKSVYISDAVAFNDGLNYFLSGTSDPEFGKYFSDGIQLMGEINEDNGRAEMLLAIKADTGIPAAPSNGRWARYRLGVEVCGDPGVHADIYSDVSGVKFSRYPGDIVPGSDMSVSDIATGDNIICVGMYVNRNGAHNLAGEEEEWGFKEGLMHPNSSYGTLSDGRILPHCAAPGAALISSYSSLYLDNMNFKEGVLYAKENFRGHDYYWGRDAGTSMACPYVAGYIATWLEANPYLTSSDVLKILDATNWRDYNDPSDPRNGQGWLRPYEGLLAAIDMSKTESLTPEADSRIRFIMDKDNIDILNPGGKDCSVLIFDVAGTLLRSFTSRGTSTSFAHALPAGIYIIKAKDSAGKETSGKHRI